jgi:hypothetical protein
MCVRETETERERDESVHTVSSTYRMSEAYTTHTYTRTHPQRREGEGERPAHH